MSTRRSRPPTANGETVDAHSRNGNTNGNGTLPPPNTYGQYKANQGKDEEKGLENPFKAGIKPAGESGRRGFHPWKFLRISFRSTSKASLVCNVLWPIVPAAIAVRYAQPERHELIFILAYIAMIPPANLIGFSGQELARKLPHVFGVLMEITAGSIVEIILFMVLLKRDLPDVLKAAILGSILATLLLCLGLCFFAGGFGREDQHFSEVISETGSGLLLVAGVILAVPVLYSQGISAVRTDVGAERIAEDTLHISRIIAILLLISYAVYVFFQVRSHHGIYDAIFEHDEERDQDGQEDLAKAKLTLTECIIGLIISVALVSILAVTLVLQIEPVIEQGHVSDAFMGLILVPLVEKFAEHLTAIDEAWDNQMNFALSHVLGATLQTALFNAPLAIVVGWGLGKNIDLNFDLFTIVMLLLSILTVGRFLQDQKSNYFEGFLLVITYVAVAVAAFYIPDPAHAAGGEGGSGEGGASHE